MSVIVPAYNRERYIGDALDSVLAQDASLEILVCDDGSTDGTIAVVERKIRAHPHRVRLLRHEGCANRGIAATRNAAIAEARGELVAFLDSDDLWLPSRATRHLEVFARYPDIGLCFSQSDFIDETGAPMRIGGVSRNAHRVPPGVSHLFPSLQEENTVYTSTVTVRRSVLNDVGMMREHGAMAFEDWELWLRIAFYYPVYHIPEVLARTRYHRGNVTLQRAQVTHLDSELRMIVDLYGYLFTRGGGAPGAAETGFSSSVRRMFYRARAYGADRAWSECAVSELTGRFPSHEDVIVSHFRRAARIPVVVARGARWLRRKLIRL